MVIHRGFMRRAHPGRWKKASRAAFRPLALLALAVLLLLHPGAAAVPAHAAGAVLSLVPVTSTFGIGDTTVVSINLSSVSGAYGYQFQVSYDASKVSATGAFANTFFDTADNAFAPGGWNAVCTAGVCKFAATKMRPAAPSSGAGEIARITFTGLAAGDVPLTISGSLLGDQNGLPLAHTVAGATLHVVTGDHVTIPFTADWNLITLPLQPTTSYTAETLLLAINATAPGRCTEIDRWRSGSWQSHTLSLPFNNFSIVMGAGYFLRCSLPHSWTMYGTALTQSVPLTFNADWNLIGVPYSSSALTASTLLSGINGGTTTCTEINRWSAGTWETYRYGLPIHNFAIESFKGYFVKCTAPTSYDGNRPAQDAAGGSARAGESQAAQISGEGFVGFFERLAGLVQLEWLIRLLP